MANDATAVTNQVLEEESVCWAAKHCAQFLQVMRILSGRIPRGGAAFIDVAFRALNRADDLPIDCNAERRTPSKSHPLTRLHAFGRSRGVALVKPGPSCADPACDGAVPFATGPILNEASLHLVGAPLPATVMGGAPPHGVSPTNFANAVNNEAQSCSSLLL